MKNCPQCNLAYPSDSTFCFIDGATLVATDDAGDSVAGLYRAIEPVGESPWARISRARYRLTTSQCLLKVWKAPLAEPARRRFNEALGTARRVGMPGLVAEVIGGGIASDGRPFAAYPPLEGRPLTEQVRKGPLELARALGTALQILRALGHVHDFGGAHGDLRPSNVLVGPDGRVTLLEAALGRCALREPWEEDGQSFPAQRYLAPELSPEKRASAEADLFALGALLFQMLTKKLPAEAADVRELRSKLTGLTADTTRGALGDKPPRVTAFVAALCERFPQNRPQTQHALDELGALCEELGVTVPPPPRPRLEIEERPPRPAPELDPTFARWGRYLGLFRKMAQIGFPNGPPPDLQSTLATLAGKLESLNEIAKQGSFHLGNLEDALERARDGRERLAAQMAEVNTQAREVRAELAPLKLAAEKHAAKSATFKPLLLELHKELVRWEGRSGFTEPYKELADAYRGMADLVEKWWGVRSAQLACETDAAKHDQQFSELGVQLEELRAALRVHESNVTQEIDSAAEELGGLGLKADEIEPELVQLATRFSAPLRSKPELGQCFRELQQLPK
ncbi:MAG: protein kinase [Polyangiaceae bacterium]|nr:protein kinase [Polyangiaceae bacterium]